LEKQGNLTNYFLCPGDVLIPVIPEGRQLNFLLCFQVLVAECYVVYTNIASDGTVCLVNLMKNERFEAVAVVLMVDWRDEKACNQTCKFVFGF
jgi:Pyruvate/2-oxoacid:ferredoxin oxidoreductase gamma subunit